MISYMNGNQLFPKQKQLKYETMNRVIKFRGKCIKSGDMVFGDLIHGVGHKNGKVYILPHRENLAYVKHCDPLDGVEVDPSTVGQFTGLCDKNGKEIFEGDVLQGVSNNTFSKGLVNKYKIMWGIDHWHADRTNFTLQELFNYCANNIAVTGNIHDNPELLK